MKKITGWILMVLFTIVSVSDMVLTWINTPDLTREANPLISRLGLGWTALIIANVLVLALYLFLVHYAFIAYPEKKKMSRIGTGMPGSSTLALLGYTISFSLLISRIFPVYEWTLITLNKSLDSYKAFTSKLPTNRPDIVIAGTLALLFAVQWTIADTLEERRYKSAIRGEGGWMN